MGVPVEKLRLQLSEAGAFLSANIAGVMTLRTDIHRFQIVRRPAVNLQKCLPLLFQITDHCVQVDVTGIRAAQQMPGLLNACVGDLVFDLLQSGHGSKGFITPPVGFVSVTELSVVVDLHDHIILFIRQSHMISLSWMVKNSCDP